MQNETSGFPLISVTTYGELSSRFDLYRQIQEGMDDIIRGNTRSFADAMADIRQEREKNSL